MNTEIYKFEMPISAKELALVERAVRHTDVLTFFDHSVEPSEVLRYRLEKAKFDTDTFALLDLNCFKDILALARNDPSRSTERLKFAAALCLFFQCADINIEPGCALHESPSEAAEELTLFRRIDNTDPKVLMKVVSGELRKIPENCLPEMSRQEPEGNLHRSIHGELVTEIALLKLSSLIREPTSPYDRLGRFLAGSLSLDRVHRLR